MGREIKRVPLDFTFPIDGSYADAQWSAHRATCDKTEDDCVDACDYEQQPPKGDGWQLWQTVSDGPVTPVFDTPEKLIDYMSQPDPKRGYPSLPWGTGWKRETAEKFVRSDGWMPSMISVGGRFLTTDEHVDFVTRDKAAR